MYDDDRTAREMLAAELAAALAETARLQHEIDAMESDLARAVELLQAIGHEDLALDLLRGLGDRRPTLR